MGTQNLWVHKICDDTKFQVSGREYQNMCVLCITCEQKNIHVCAFSIYAFCHMCKNIPCELGFSMKPIYFGWKFPALRYKEASRYGMKENLSIR